MPYYIINKNSTTVKFQNKSFWGTKYHWDFGDGMVSVEKNPEHTYAVAGNYPVALTVQNWCSAKTYTQNVAAGVSAVNEPASTVFSAFPNPTSGAFTLDLKNEGAAQVRLTSLDGRMLLDRQLADGTQIDLNQYGKGVYLLQLIANGRIYTEKMVNQ